MSLKGVLIERSHGRHASLFRFNLGQRIVDPDTFEDAASLGLGQVAQDFADHRLGVPGGQASLGCRRAKCADQCWPCQTPRITVLDNDSSLMPCFEEGPLATLVRSFQRLPDRRRRVQ